MGSTCAQPARLGRLATAPHRFLQFGHVADAGVQSGTKLGPAFSNVYASDGDGGSANRVVKLLVAPLTTRPMITVEWATPAIFRNPHTPSPTTHARACSSWLTVTNTSCACCARATAQTLGAWTACGLQYGVEGAVWCARTHPELILVASMDDPQTAAGSASLCSMPRALAPI